jgi:hypothetical protein
MTTGLVTLLAASLVAARVPLGAAEPAEQQIVCPRTSEPVKASIALEDLFYNPKCAPARNEGEPGTSVFVHRLHTYLRKCPLRALEALPMEDGVAKATVAVAFAEYPELTN